jgi:hypothetical protein
MCILNEIPANNVDSVHLKKEDIIFVPRSRKRLVDRSFSRGNI